MAVVVEGGRHGAKCRGKTSRELPAVSNTATHRRNPLTGAHVVVTNEHDDARCPTPLLEPPFAPKVGECQDGRVCGVIEGLD